MSEVTARKPTKKAFYFPKSDDQATAEVKPEVESEVKSSTKGAAKPAKASKKAKPVAATEPGKSRRAKSKAEVAASAAPPAAAPTEAAAETAAEAAPEAPAAESAKKPARSAAGKGKDKRAKKEKVVRDSFTMPKADYDRIASLKQKCLEAGVSVKKSELLRAGLQLLESSSAKRLVAAIAALETVKTGRPAKDE
jgi:hypothetical protein